MEESEYYFEEIVRKMIEEMNGNKEIKKTEGAENKDLKEKECPICGQKTLVYKPQKMTESELIPAYCDC